MDSQTIQDSTIKRAFDLVDELNKIQNMLHKEYTLRIDSTDVATLADSHSVYSFRLTVGRDVKRSL